MPVREVDLELAVLREVVRRLWQLGEHEPTARGDQEKANAGLWGAVVPRLQEAKADLVAIRSER